MYSENFFLDNHHFSSSQLWWTFLFFLGTYLILWAGLRNRRCPAGLLPCTGTQPHQIPSPLWSWVCCPVSKHTYFNTILFTPLCFYVKFLQYSTVLIMLHTIILMLCTSICDHIRTCRCTDFWVELTPKVSQVWVPSWSEINWGCLPFCYSLCLPSSESIQDVC